MAKFPEFRSRWEPSPRWVEDPGKLMTRQEFADECDINNIMKKAVKTGTVATRTDMARFGDFSEAPDFMEAQNVVIKARDQFATLPSSLRTKFDNDPSKFLAWVHSKEFDLEDAKQYGILSEEGVKKVAERVSVREAKAAEAKAAEIAAAVAKATGK